jgi:hypothetical protein
MTVMINYSAVLRHMFDIFSPYRLVCFSRGVLATIILNVWNVFGFNGLQISQTFYL